MSSLLSKTIGRHVNLGSSSEGNCYYLELNLNSGKNFKVLIECGFERNKLMGKLIDERIDVSDIDMCLVTHEHDDHSKNVIAMQEWGVDVYAPESVFEKYKIETNEKFIMKELKRKKINEHLYITSLPLTHYGTNDELLEHLGYIITVNNDFNILFVIDTNFVDFDLSDYKFNMIYQETNFIEQRVLFAEITARNTRNKNNIKRYDRLRKSHFSLENATKFLCGYKTKEGFVKGLNLSETEIIILTHLTSDKTTKPHYYKEFLKAHLQYINPKTTVLVARRTGGYI